jgi:23S rRNA (adenine2503-C2)-methyltransferase
MPINKKYPLEVLIPACIDYVRKTKRRVTYEYILIRGINASPKDAVKLANLLRNHLCHVNIIPLNPVKEKHYCSPNEKEVDAFAEVLKNEGINLTIRKEMGADIDAACGQLRRRFLREKNCKC